MEYVFLIIISKKKLQKVALIKDLAYAVGVIIDINCFTIMFIIII